MRKALNDLIFLGVIEETVEIAGHNWVLKTLTTEEQLEATSATANYSDYVAKVYSLTIEILTRALKQVDDQKLDDKKEVTEFVKQLQPVIINKLYEQYLKIQEKQNKSLESVEEVK